MDESEYERKRRENMRQNAAALAALGLDDESTRLQERKRPRAEPRERKERAIQPKQKTSLRAAGVGAECASGSALFSPPPRSPDASPYP